MAFLLGFCFAETLPAQSAVERVKKVAIVALEVETGEDSAQEKACLIDSI